MCFLKKEKPGKYANVYDRHILEHFYPGDLRKLFSNAYRIIKKGGRFVAVFPNTKNLNVTMSDFQKDETHARPYAKDVVGFRIVEKVADADSRDNSLIKNIVRIIRGAITGITQEPPDCFIVAEK